MDKQEIFETVARHLFKQGKPAMGPFDNMDDDMCLYRTHEGGKCAFGVLIPDELYSPEFENVSASCLLRTNVSRSDEEPNTKIRKLQDMYAEHLSLIADLQNAHDRQYNWHTSEVMRKRLLEVAEIHNLDSAFLLTISFADR